MQTQLGFQGAIMPGSKSHTSMMITLHTDAHALFSKKTVRLAAAPLRRVRGRLVRATVASLWSNLAMGCYNAASLRSFSPHPCLPWFVRNGCIVNFACHGRTRIRYAVPDHSLDSFFAFATRTTVSIESPLFLRCCDLQNTIPNVAHVPRLPEVISLSSKFTR